MHGHRRSVLAALAVATGMILAIPTPALAAAGDVRWISRYDGSGLSDSGWGVLSPDGTRMYVGGETQTDVTNSSGLLISYDTMTGGQLWATTYDGPGRRDFFDGLQASPDGSKVFVIDWQWPATSLHTDWLVLGFDAATGSRLWTTPLGSAGRSEYPTAMQTSPDGSLLFVTGVSHTDGGPTTVAYDTSDGSIAWTSRCDGPRRCGGYGIGVSPDGAMVVVAGYTAARGSRPEEATTIAYDAATGTQEWIARVRGAYYFEGVGISPDGSTIFVTGSQYGARTGYAIRTVAYRADDGTRLWSQRLQGPARDDEGGTLVVSPDGSRVFVNGQTRTLQHGFDYRTVAYDAGTGDELWTSRFDGPAHRYDGLDAGTLSPDGHMLYVVGTSAGAGTKHDVGVVAYDTSTGAAVWTYRYDGPDHRYDQGWPAGVSPDGSTLYIAGSSQGATTGADVLALALATR